MIVQYLHNYTSRLESAVALCMKLPEEFKDVVPDLLTFSVGNFEGQNHSKIWLVTREDFWTMYGKYPKGEITLWWDGQTEQEDDTSGRKKRKRDEISSKRQEREDEVDDIYKELKEKHGENITLQGYVYGLDQKHVKCHNTVQIHSIKRHYMRQKCF